jgi:hypothetical protein
MGHCKDCEGASLMPPLVTASWIRHNAHLLNERQRDGEFCCYCGLEVRQMVPVGLMGARQLFACYPACKPAQGPERP